MQADDHGGFVLRALALLPGSRIVGDVTFEDWRASVWERLGRAFAEENDPRYADQAQRLEAGYAFMVAYGCPDHAPLSPWWQRLVNEDLRPRELALRQQKGVAHAAS